MKTYVHLRHYLAEFGSEWENFQTKFVHKIKTHILGFKNSPPPWKSCRLWEDVEKCGTARDATDDNIIRRLRIACWILKATDTLKIFNTYCFSTATMVARTRLIFTFIHALPVLFKLFPSNVLYFPSPITRWGVFFPPSINFTFIMKFIVCCFYI